MSLPLSLYISRTLSLSPSVCVCVKTETKAKRTRQTGQRKIQQQVIMIIMCMSYGAASMHL